MAQPNALPIDEVVREACAGRTELLDELLLRRGGLPGPRPNLKLGISVAQSLARQGERGRACIDAMRRLDDRAAPAGSAYPVLAMVGVLGLGCVAVHANDESARGKVLQDLQEHADDSRREIRDAVAVALELCLKELPSETLAHLETWKDGYFHSELMLRAVFQPAVLQRVNDVQAPLSRLQESFALAAGAPRAHQRSQGYRALLKTMTVAISELGKRFPQPVMRWLKENATVATKDLLAALNDALDQLRAAGLRSGDAQAVRDALDSAVPPPRDPRWDVGPTRERGRKARIKGRRRKA